MAELTQEERLECLKSHGVDPEELRKHNPLFYKNILLRIRGKSGCKNLLQYDQLWFVKGNPSIMEKLGLDKKDMDVDAKEALEETKAKERLENLKKPSGKKNVVHGIRKK